MKPSFKKYKWKEIEFPAGQKEWQKFEQNKTIALYIFIFKTQHKKITVVYRSKHNNKREKQVIFLMIGDGKKYHYLEVTNLSALLKKVSSNRKEDFYCLNSFNSYTTKNKLKENEEICNNHDSCRVEMPEWVNKKLKHNPGEKSLQAPLTISIDLECLVKKEQPHNNNNNNDNNNNINNKNNDF